MSDQEITEAELLVTPYDPVEIERDLSVNTKLTDRQNRFVDLYMLDFNVRNAAKGAGYSPWTIKTAREKILNNPRIREEIERRKVEDRHRFADLDEKIIASFEKLAFSDTKSMFNDDGSIKPINEIDDDMMYAVESVDTETKFIGRGKDQEEVKVTKVRMSKRIEALRELAKMRGMYQLDNTVILDVGFKGILQSLPANIREIVKLELMKRIESK